MFSSTDEARDGSTGQRTGPSVKVVQQDPQCLRLKFDDGELPSDIRLGWVTDGLRCSQQGMGEGVDPWL
ncbi:hypothetical protein E2C01_060035 [Portunus trituberculatus]|uniref:Uncharacterized protein n=1 Tax=Portunus trituberculatus TaxID=210409 RepID=A0A5B7H9D3_PORTR|nr:hypothetical protein [Portunus trituberculatus]